MTQEIRFRSSSIRLEIRIITATSVKVSIIMKRQEHDSDSTEEPINDHIPPVPSLFGDVFYNDRNY